MLLAGRNAIVTGGAAGIGRAVCERLAAEGASVVICDIDVERGLALQTSLRSQGANAWSVSCDVSNIASIDMMVAQAIELAGSINILVNNAGVTRRIGLLDMDEENWDWIQAINTKGLFFCLQRVAATELARYGINVNSVCPGLTRTELVDRMIRQNPAAIDDIIGHSVLRRFMEPADIADAVLFLCSALSRNITGQSINVDGGTMWD